MMITILGITELMFVMRYAIYENLTKSHPGRSNYLTELQRIEDWEKADIGE